MRVLIVDGHSLIFAWPEMRSLHVRRNLLAREALIKTLTEYQDYSGVHVAVVFDGAGPTLTDATEPGGIQVFYSAAGETADSVIERLVARYGAENEITVATSDRLEQTTASSFGASCVSPEGLKTMINQAREGFQRDLKAHRRR